MSGLYPEAAGVLHNTTDIGRWRPGTPAMPGVFRGAGYWTAAVGKVVHRPLDNPGGNAWFNRGRHVALHEHDQFDQSEGVLPPEMARELERSGLGGCRGVKLNSVRGSLAVHEELKRL